MEFTDWVNGNWLHRLKGHEAFIAQAEVDGKNSIFMRNVCLNQGCYLRPHPVRKRPLCCVLFGYNTYYPAGGDSDILAVTKTPEQAASRAREFYSRDEVYFSFYEVVEIYESEDGELERISRALDKDAWD